MITPSTLNVCSCPSVKNPQSQFATWIQFCSWRLTAFATNTYTTPITICVVTACLTCGNLLIRWLQWLDECSDCIGFPCIVVTVISSVVSSPSVSVKGPMISFVGLQVCALAPGKMCGPANICFDCRRRSTEAFDLFHVFQTLFCALDIHYILQLAVGVAWCFQFKCDVPSIGRAFTCLSLCQCLFCLRTRELCQELDNHHRTSHLCLSRLGDHGVASSTLGHEHTSHRHPT